MLGALVLALASAAAPVQAKLYKWVDENGNVHYSDTVPPEHARQGREVKSRSGQTVEEVPPPPTEEELERQRREQARREAEREREAERRERDRVLLMSYSSVEQIERTRDQRLDTLESRINITESRLEKLRGDLERERERAAAAERSGRGDPAQIHQRVEEIVDRIERNEAVIEDTRREMDQIREQFAAEIERYRELTDE